MPRVMEHDLMGRVAQEGGPARHRGQDAALAFDPQVASTPDSPATQRTNVSD